MKEVLEVLTQTKAKNEFLVVCKCWRQERIKEIKYKDKEIKEYKVINNNYYKYHKNFRFFKHSKINS